MGPDPSGGGLRFYWSLIMNHIAQPANKLEHVIGYAYPTSPDALAVTAKLGTVPGRWSKDHPMNAACTC